MSKNIVPLTFTNNWETHEYSVKGKLIENMNHIYVKNKETGEYDKIKIHGCENSVSYSDMGHICHAISRHYYIKNNVLGINIDVPLVELINKKPKLFYVDTKTTRFYK